jgi:hypothetical protein
LSRCGVNDEETQREFLQVETDAELADDAVCAWNLQDMDFNALTKAFSDLRMRLERNPSSVNRSAPAPGCLMALGVEAV